MHSAHVFVFFLSAKFKAGGGWVASYVREDGRFATILEISSIFCLPLSLQEAMETFSNGQNCSGI